MKKLKNGWVEGSARDFLDLDQADMEFIETRLALSRKLKAERIKRHLTQTALAERLETSQSRVAKMETGDPSVSLDLLVEALYRMGLTRKRLAAAM